MDENIVIPVIETPVVVETPISKYNINFLCETVLKNKSYLIIGIVVFGLLLYYLYTTYFKNKQSLLNFKNFYKSNESDEPLNDKKKVVNEKKGKKKVVIESDFSESESDLSVVVKPKKKSEVNNWKNKSSNSQLDSKSSNEQLDTKSQVLDWRSKSSNEQLDTKSQVLNWRSKSSNEQSEPEHLNRLNLTPDEIEMIHKQLTESTK
jgi:hypothetical protein